MSANKDQIISNIKQDEVSNNVPADPISAQVKM